MPNRTPLWLFKGMQGTKLLRWDRPVWSFDSKSWFIEWFNWLWVTIMFLKISVIVTQRTHFKKQLQLNKMYGISWDGGSFHFICNFSYKQQERQMCL